MRLTPPAFATWFIALLIGALATAGKLGYFPAAAPYSFWMMTVAFVMLVLGSLLKGL
ncbi:hypothetical protein [Solilutibacter pythonis]|uniref:hypothetical protein n=1 Tax=Solilutibacter pythonis TaxID=2483112 RepID=UPI001314CBCF|nr:hypothetical protein [Lysobacter pythonis]